MAEFHATFQVIGGGSVQLPVTFLTPVPLTITDQPATVDFSVQNILDREVVFPSVGLTVSGPGDSKVSVSLLMNAMTIPALGSAQNTVSVQPNEPLMEGDSPTISIDAVGG